MYTQIQNVINLHTKYIKKHKITAELILDLKTSTSLASLTSSGTLFYS